MAALQRIGVLVERGAVEMAEAVRIVGEMPGHPVQHHADAFAMAGVDQRGEILPACRTGWSARTCRSADSPTSRRTDAR